VTRRTQEIEPLNSIRILGPCPRSRRGAGCMGSLRWNQEQIGSREWASCDPPASRRPSRRSRPTRPHPHPRQSSRATMMPPRGAASQPAHVLSKPTVAPATWKQHRAVNDRSRRPDLNDTKQLPQQWQTLGLRGKGVEHRQSPQRESTSATRIATFFAVQNRNDSRLP